MPLKIAAKIDAADREYFESTIAPLFGASLRRVHRGGRRTRKNELLSNAYALLFPIDWPEPFGLVMIEAIACGTPVIAYRRGSVPEIIEDGVTGFVVTTSTEPSRSPVGLPASIDGAAGAVFEERFVAARMAGDYVSVYDRLVSARGRRLAATPDRGAA